MFFFKILKELANRALQHLVQLNQIRNRQTGAAIFDIA